MPAHMTNICGNCH